MPGHIDDVGLSTASSSRLRRHSLLAFLPELLRQTCCHSPSVPAARGVHNDNMQPAEIEEFENSLLRQATTFLRARTGRSEFVFEQQSPENASELKMQA